MTTAVPIRWPETGELIRRVIVRVWVDRANAAFGVDQIFAAGILRWAKIQPVVGVAYWGGKQIKEEVTHKIWLRFGEGTRPEEITGQHVIDHRQGNRRYRVLRATHAGDANQFTCVDVKDIGVIPDDVA